MSRQRLLIDAELLVLLIVGIASPSFIPVHKNLSAYSKSDFDFLLSILSLVPNVVVTPNTLTEASNLARQTREPMRTLICAALRELASQQEEIYVASRAAVERPEFTSVGLTDSVLLSMLGPTDVLLTADHLLVQLANAAGHEVVNFRYLPRA